MDIPKVLLLLALVWTLWARLFFSEIVPEIRARTPVVSTANSDKRNSDLMVLSNAIATLLWASGIAAFLRTPMRMHERIALLLSLLLVGAASFLIEGYVFRKVMLPFGLTILT